MKIVKLTHERFNDYTEFLLQQPDTLIYHSLPFRNLLTVFLKSEDYYLIALDANDKIIGALPVMMIRSANNETVINSLPFYGSNGGVITAPNDLETKNALLQSYMDVCVTENALSSVLIESPLGTNDELYRQTLKPDFIDERIGQLTFFDESIIDSESLMQKLHYKTRNTIRKAQKLGLHVYEGNTAEIKTFLVETHKQNIEALGGLSKPSLFFDLLFSTLTYDKEYKIFYAVNSQNQPEAALLALYFNKTVEYFTPVVKPEFRSNQSLSLIIYEAMLDALSNGFNSWNWGGTWLSQIGVYQFKHRWGTSDLPYHYYINIRDKSIINRSKTELLNAFPYFFTVPFHLIPASNEQ